MAIKQYNPTTPARRGMTSQDLSEITTKKPLKSLLKSKKQNASLRFHTEARARRQNILYKKP